jgi:hypothetical protein
MNLQLTTLSALAIGCVKNAQCFFTYRAFVRLPVGGEGGAGKKTPYM